ncbi:uncharacterized protein LOC132705343 [Cylas formicarius]|uniref:uncharacterized protein LOC132705343 n=1 Tax=Cylas formicarius TaxID=197179 RepID=UPI002958B08D|nr:uncharacterized protein LOC132705343 [Cylas formicarius]XP_060531864.1 uncharacterized protein LOC132705343 [Cylas formicarius]
MDKVSKCFVLCYLLFSVVACKPMSISDHQSREWALQSTILNDITNLKNKLQEEMQKVKLLLDFNQHTIDNLEKDLQITVTKSKRDALSHGNDINSCVRQLKYLTRNMDLNALETCMGDKEIDSELWKLGFMVSSMAEEVKKCSLPYSPRVLNCIEQVLSKVEFESSRILKKVNLQLKLVFYEGLICVNRIASNLQDKLCKLSKDFDKCVVRKKCKVNQSK